MQQAILEGLIQWTVPAALVLLALFGGYLLYKLMHFLIARCVKAESVTLMFFDAAAPGLCAVVCLATLSAVLHALPKGLPLLTILQDATNVLMVGAMTWAAVGFTSAIGEVIVTLNPAYEQQWKRARKVETQTRFLVRCLNIVIVLVGAGAALMSFESVNKIGTSLLASAGVGGVIIGLAARPVLSNLLAGMQIALTQPFRIDDVLYVEGEWCWVEEVTITYVVLRVWDLRRLVVPLQWFIENPFENWSRYGTDLMGHALIWVDYRMPLQPLREQFKRILENTPHWNGNTATFQVVDASEHAIQIRLLMSAKSSSSLWDLRCYIREHMLDFIQREYPQFFPRVRAQFLDHTQENAKRQQLFKEDQAESI